MKVVGFTIVRNALKYDYPVLESIASILPLCDEVLVSVGKSDDDTLNLIKGIPGSKIKIMETTWDDNIRTSGMVLANETNKAKDAVSSDADWLIYIQADEVLHERGIEAARNAMLKWKDDSTVQGLLFNYKHFYGSYSYLMEPYSHWYTKEIRIIRNLPNIQSYRDAQGFRFYKNLTSDNKSVGAAGLKLKVKQIDADIFHYGWVKNPYIQKRKWDDFQKLWHNDQWISKNASNSQHFDYSNIASFSKFAGTHPAVMAARIKMQDWNFSPGKHHLTPKEQVLRFLIKTFGWNAGEYRNYKLI